MKVLTVFLAIMMAFAIQAFGLFYGVHVDIPMDNLGGVTISDGETPFPDGAVFPVSLECRKMSARYLKVVNREIVEKTDAEKAFADLPARYKKQVGGQWVEMTAEEKRIVDLPSKYKHPDGSEMTPEEKAAVDASEEAERQASKTTSLKMAENNFLVLCDTLDGGTNHAKMGFSELKEIITQIPDTNTQVIITLQLLSVDAEAKREGGLLWWDDCAWHPDLYSLRSKMKRAVAGKDYLSRKERKEFVTSAGSGLVSGAVAGLLGSLGVAFLVLRKKNS